MGEPTFAERYAAFARFNPEHVKRRLDTLAHNLAMAGGLCRAYDIGMERMSMIWCRDEIDPVRDWRPGCGRTAPGWRDR